MQIGLSADLAKIAWARDLGFDYLEVPAFSVSEYSEDEFERLRADAEASGLPVYSSNALVPWQRHIYGPDGIDSGLPEYFRQTFARLSRLGVRLSVFGCGGARKFLDGVSYAQGADRFAEAFRMAAREAEAFGIAVAMESLAPRETNLGNYLSECALIVHAAGVAPCHGVTADWFHMSAVHEPPSEISRCGIVRHVHVAAGGSRRVPSPSDPDPYGELFAQVRAVGLDCVTVESGAGEDADYRAALALFRSL